MPKFSVVIPLYNKANFIVRTLESVLAQSMPDFEIVLVNDASTDDSWDISKQVSDPRIRYVSHQKNKGLSAARNTGINAANAPYIAFLDADDVWKPNYLDTMNTLITVYPEASLFASTYELILENGTSHSNHLDFLKFEKHGMLENFFTSNLNQNIYYPSCLTVKKAVFDVIGMYNEAIQFSEDVDFNIRAHAMFSMAFTKEPLVTYEVASENQITQSPLGTKVIPDYGYYEKEYENRPDIKKYLDFQRYVKAKMYKLDGDDARANILIGQLSTSNLTWKQRLLLKMPSVVLKCISQSKKFLLLKGINVNSYQN